MDNLNKFVSLPIADGSLVSNKDKFQMLLKGILEVDRKQKSFEAFQQQVEDRHVAKAFEETDTLDKFAEMECSINNISNMMAFLKKDIKKTNVAMGFNSAKAIECAENQGAWLQACDIKLRGVIEENEKLANEQALLRKEVDNLKGRVNEIEKNFEYLSTLVTERNEEVLSSIRYHDATCKKLELNFFDYDTKLKYLLSKELDRNTTLDSLIARK
jgi:hypothetical protein